MKRNRLLLLSLLMTSLIFAQSKKDKPIPKGIFKSYSLTCSDGQVRPYIVYLPETYDKDKSTLLVYLHGAVMRDSVSKKPLKAAQRSSMCQLAEAGGYALLFPYADKHASWFNDIGNQMLFDEIEAVVKDYQIDPKKIFLSGFSDGASGTFYIAMNHPDRFAAFIALNGYPPVASQLGESQCYIDNLKHKSIYIVNTKGDLLYPASEVEPMVDFMKQRDIDVTFKTPEGNHFLSYLPAETANIINFIDKNPNIEPSAIDWEFNREETNAVAWIVSMSLDTLVSHQDWYQDINLSLTDSSANFNLEYDNKYKGPGLKVSGYRGEKSLAKAMGVLPGDIIAMMEKDTVTSFYTPYFYYFKKRAGDSTQLSIIRDGETIVLDGQFDPPHDFELFKHAKASGKLIAHISNNNIQIKTSRIREVCLDFSKIPYDSAHDVEIILNGVSQIKRKIKPDERLCLD